MKLRRRLIWEKFPLFDYFHASEDKQNVRDKVFALSNHFDFQIQATIMEKSKAMPQVRVTEERFYKYAWFYHMRHAGPMSSRTPITLGMILILAVSLSGCGDKCREYSDFACSYLEKATYSVEFGYPRGERFERIGTAEGLAACGGVARAFANAHNMANADWSYVCCLHAKGSDCYEKHRYRHNDLACC